MMGYNGYGSKKRLDRDRKEAIGLISIGTFLEYFDLMLYVHMAVLLNEIFFPKTDPYTHSLLSAFAFSSTYVLRPFGALIFGYIGDNIGRKATVIITTTMMSISCVVMANLPTYAQIGITASWIVTLCRMIQGLSTMGEVIGANIYITEITRPPIQYVAVTLISIIGVLGGACALATASFANSKLIDWRIAFWIGAGIAIVGGAARTKLRETVDYTNAKKMLKFIEDRKRKSFIDESKKKLLSKKIDRWIALSIFAIECSWPVCFYIAFMYCGTVLKVSFDLSSDKIIQQNFLVSISQLFSWIILAYLSYRIFPLKILRVKMYIFFVFVLLLPFMLNWIVANGSPTHILFIQMFIVVFGFMGTPAMPIFYEYFPVLRRVTFATFAYALSRAFIYVITSFGLAFASDKLGHYGVWTILIPTSIAYYCGLSYFLNRSEEKTSGLILKQRRAT